MIQKPFKEVIAEIREMSDAKHRATFRIVDSWLAERGWEWEDFVAAHKIFMAEEAAWPEGKATLSKRKAALAKKYVEEHIKLFGETPDNQLMPPKE